jgi:hypothetical protein
MHVGLDVRYATLQGPGYAARLGRHSASIRGVVSHIRTVVAPRMAWANRSHSGRESCGALGEVRDDGGQGLAAAYKCRQWHDSPTGTENAANAYPQARTAITSRWGGWASRFGIVAINGKGPFLLAGLMPSDS